MSDFFKTKIRNPLIFFVSVLVLFSIATTCILLVQKQNKIGLQRTIINFLEKKYPNRFDGIVYEPIKNTAGYSIFAWNIHDKKPEINESSNKKIIVLRVTGICGPVPVVFLYEQKKSKIKCLGIPSESNPENLAKFGITTTLISHWEKVIFEIFPKDSEGTK